MPEFHTQQARDAYDALQDINEAVANATVNSLILAYHRGYQDGLKAQAKGN